MPKLNTSLLQAGKTYHIYNQGNNGVNLFSRNGNYHYFLKKYKEKLSPFVNTFAYCLLPNHFHMVVQIKNYVELHEASTNNYFPKPKAGLITAYDVFEIEDSDYDHAISIKISHRFARFFAGYAQAFNKETGQKDKLFALPFKRLVVEDEFYFENLIAYVHRNPIHHGLVSNYENWQHSSYFEILENWNKSNPNGIIDVPFLKDWFETKENFIELLENSKAIYEESQLYLE